MQPVQMCLHAVHQKPSTVLWRDDGVGRMLIGWKVGLDMKENNSRGQQAKEPKTAQRDRRLLQVTIFIVLSLVWFVFVTKSVLD